MSKTISGTTTQFLYDKLNPVQELNGSNGVVANLLTGLRIDEYFTRTAGGTTSTFLADALGSTIGLVSANNGPLATSDTYQPFGATTVGGAANGNSYEFTGRENDGTGLYFYRARYYSPTFQRFVSQDLIDFAGGDANLYAYVRNAATDSTDRRGLFNDGSGPVLIDSGSGGGSCSSPKPPSPAPCTGPMTPGMCVVCVNALIDVPGTGGVAACALTGPGFPECALGVTAGCHPWCTCGYGCLFFGIAPTEVQQTWDRAPMLLGSASFISFQILLVYLFLKVRRR